MLSVIKSFIIQLKFLCNADNDCVDSCDSGDDVLLFLYHVNNKSSFFVLVVGGGECVLLGALILDKCGISSFTISAIHDGDFFPIAAVVIIIIMVESTLNGAIC